MLIDLVSGRRSSSPGPRVAKPKVKFVNSFLDPETAMSLVLARPKARPRKLTMDWYRYSPTPRREPTPPVAERPVVEDVVREVRGMEFIVHRSSWSDRVQYIVAENGIRHAYSRQQFAEKFGFDPLPQREAIDLEPLFRRVKLL